MKNLEMTPIDMLIVLAVIAFFGLMAGQADAQDVKYCKNYETGAVIVVQAGMPCPYPTVEL